jgi:Na+-translocating ferredoxin:NAD+ oxidoreductase subunit B
MDILIPVLIVGTIGLIAGVVLTIASKLMHVTVDEKVVKIAEKLPGANCGACGFAGCEDYANALVHGENISTALCPVGGAYMAIAIAEELGVDADASEPEVATVMCRGYSDAIRRVSKHDKVWSCRAATQLYGGQMECNYGCLGMGDCEKVCPSDAINIIDGLAIVDDDKCTGCRLCIKACPKKIIIMRPVKRQIYVACKSLDTGLITMKACDQGCIACKKCVDVCKFDAIKVENNLAVMDYDKCTQCGMCEKVCITGAIVNLRKR